MFKSGFLFVNSNLNVEGKLPVNLIENYTFRRARDDEIDHIRNYQEGYQNQGVTKLFLDRFCVDITLYKTDSGLQAAEYPMLPRDQWRYWVIAYEEQNLGYPKLVNAAKLLETDFELGLEVYFPEADQRGMPSGCRLPHADFDPLDRDFAEMFEPPRTLTVDSIAEIPKLIAKIQETSERLPFFQNALRTFILVDSRLALPDFRIVGFFSVIEALITHKPRAAETLDSISHQVVNKAILLCKRFKRRIDPIQFFALNKTDYTEEKVWKALYSLRSCIAHGDTPDLQKKDFRIFKNRQAPPRFLREVIKELLILALNEPSLVQDLRNC